MTSLNIAGAFDREETKGCFWKIKDGNGNKGYLLGSIHTASAELLDPKGKIMRCFQKSQVLAVEIDTTEGSELLNSIRKIRLEEINNQLRESDPNSTANLAENSRQFLYALGHKEALGDLSDDENAISMAVILLLDTFSRNIQNERAGGGMELKLTVLAKKRSIRVHDLESVQGYIDFNWENLKEQVRSLFDILQNVDATKIKPDYLQKINKAANEKLDSLKMELENLGMYENWKKGNLEYFEFWNQTGGPSPEFNLNETPRKPTPYELKLLSRRHHIRMNRNNEMAENFAKMMKNDERLFAVVGVGHTVGAGFKHMPGEFSILSFLKRSGFKVTRVSQ